MYKKVAILAAVVAFAASVSATEESLQDLAVVDSEEGRDGTISLSGGSGNNFLTNAIYIVPLLAAIIILDFAIFGTFATRSDELNPVSQFFFKAKEGLNIIRNRNSYANRNSFRHPLRPQRVAR